MSTSAHAEQSPVTHESPTTCTDAERPSFADGDPMASGNLDKIRDILFGAQARDHERRFAQLEQHLIREATDLRTDLKCRFDTLEAYIQKEVDALTTSLKKEEEMRSGSVQNLMQELAKLAGTLESKAHQLESQTVQAQAHLQQQLIERAGELATDIRARHAEVTSALHRAVQDLRAEKTDRSSLAAILMEASKRLSDDHAHADNG
ncbi:MAG: hypothetical protein Q8L77_07855 [Nitrospirota bacterium]|nr:hypothetical protein [Nitrospirota bacterium]